MTKVRKLINENVAFVGLILLILLGVCVQRTFIYPENLTIWSVRRALQVFWQLE